MIRLLALLIVLLWWTPADAQNVTGEGGSGSGVTTIASGTEVPATCTPGDLEANGLFLDTDDGVLYFCEATDTLTPLNLAAEADTLDTVFDRGKIINGANSEANAFQVGDGTTPICLFTDATLGPVIKPCTDSNTRTYIWNGYTWGLRDIEGDADMFIVDPDATGNDKYAWQSGYRPIKTVSFPADALYVAGSAALVTDTALISGGLVSPYITVTDSNSDYFYRYVVMDPKWDGGTVTATITVVNVNGTPANNFEVDVSGACYPAGTVIPTTISTTGEQAANIDFDASGACGGSACSQNDPASATTAAITINGTPAGGNFCGFQAQVDATATTETVSGIKIVQMDIHYGISKGF